MLLARVANNVGESFGSMLDMLAQELAKSVRELDMGRWNADQASTV
jgi:hypothetical protein